ncbi:MAG: T9SS type A sorting domain-containing protein, partial [Bacteroidetes bacterium]|nr:T9SS type A sorting domain-containing protein [Bacteroidota bacterium]
KQDFTFGRSLNIGCEFSKGSYLIFISGHCVPTNSSWLKNLVQPIMNGECDYTYGRQVGRDTTKYSEQQVFSKYFPLECSVPNKGFFCNNANAALLKSTWEKYKFDEFLTGLEDMHLAKKIVDNGHFIGYVSTAVVYHIHDETWGQMVITNTLPERPDWVNVYLADSMGNMRPPGRELAGLLYTGIEEWEIDQSPETELSVYPNPVSNEMVIKCFLQDRDKIQIGVYSLTGQLVNSIFSDEKPPGDNEIHWNAQSLPGGVYFIRLTTKNGLIHSKIVKH